MSLRYTGMLLWRSATKQHTNKILYIHRHRSSVRGELLEASLLNSLHTKLFLEFKHDEAIPLKQNNETKRCTFEIWFAHKEIVNWEDYGNDEDYRLRFLISNLVIKNSDIRFKTQRAYVEVCRQATLWRCPHNYEDMGVEWVKSHKQ